MPAADPDPGRNGRYSRSWILVALVLVAAAAAVLVIQRSAAPPVVPMEPAVPGIAGEPDVYMQDALISQFRPDGSLQYRLAAREIQHYQGESRTQLSEPYLTLHDETGAPWQVRARTGAIRAAGESEEVVILRHDVMLEQTRPDGENIQLTTPFLRLFPQRQYAETDRDVMIRGDVGRTTAKGLEGDLQAGSIRLFSAGELPVHTTLLPEQFK